MDAFLTAFILLFSYARPDFSFTIRYTKRDGSALIVPSLSPQAPRDADESFSLVAVFKGKMLKYDLETPVTDQRFLSM